VSSSLSRFHVVSIMLLYVQLCCIAGPERAFPLSPAERFSSLRRPADQPPTIRDIPIRIESTADANRMSLHR
jgi:hypothetical protein